jgi:hypothetical protein
LRRNTLRRLTTALLLRAKPATKAAGKIKADGLTVRFFFLIFVVLGKDEFVG